MDELRPPSHFALGLLHDVEKASRIGAVEPSPGEAQPGSDLLPGPLRRFGPELLQALADALLEILMGHIPTPVTHQSPLLREQTGDGQPVEGRENQPVSQITRRPVQDERGGLRSEAGIGHGEALLTCVNVRRSRMHRHDADKA